MITMTTHSVVERVTVVQNIAQIETVTLRPDPNVPDKYSVIVLFISGHQLFFHSQDYRSAKQSVTDYEYAMSRVKS